MPISEPTTAEITTAGMATDSVVRLATISRASMLRPERVGAEQVGPAVRQGERRLVGVVEVDVGGQVADEHRAEDRGEEDQAEDHGGHGGDAVVDQQAEPLRAVAPLAGAGLADDGRRWV